jgi:hypothetical protein
MSATIGKVAAVFTASTTGLTSGVNAAKASLNGMSGTVERIHGKLTMLTAIEGAKLFGSIASAATDTARSMINMGNATAQMIDEQSKAAGKLGISLDAFVALSQAAELAGVSQDKVTGAVQKMGLALVAAEGGSKKAQEAFAALGLSASELSKMSPEKAFQVIAEEIAKLPTPAERTAAAIKIFGRAGKDLAPMFEGGAEAIRQATEEAELFGTALDTVSGKQVETMNDSFTRLGKAFEGFKVQVVAAFAPAVTAGVEKVISELKNAGGMREVALDFAETVGFAVISLTEGAMHFAEIIKDALNAVKAAFDGIKNFRAFLMDLQGMGMEALSDLEWFASRSQETPASQSMREEGRRLREESYKLWRESMGLPALGADGAPQNESEMRKAFRENLERMREDQRRRQERGVPAEQRQAVERSDAQKPVTEETGKRQVTLLQQIVKAIGSASGAGGRPEVVFQLPGAAGGN